MKKLKLYIVIGIGIVFSKLDYYIFHSDIPWDIYVQSQLTAYAERDLRKKKGGE